MDKFESARDRVALVVVAGALIALLLFVAFFLSTRRDVRRISSTLESLRDNCASDLSAALDAMVHGDLTVEVTPVTPPITDISRDELGAVAVAVNEIRASTIESIGAYNRMRASLAAVIGTVSANAGTVSAASQQMAASSQETGQSVHDIAAAVRTWRRAPSVRCS